MSGEADGTPRAESGRVPEPRGRLVCPGCGGKKSKRAELCAECRRNANALGVSVVTHVHETVSPAPGRLRTPQQNLVYHGKISTLAKLEHPDLNVWIAERQVKRRALAHAATMFAHPVASSTELTELEMERLLEWLDDELDAITAE